MPTVWPPFPGVLTPGKNLFKWSQVFQNGVWVTTGVPGFTTDNIIAGPTGTVTAARQTTSTSNSSWGRYQAFTFTSATYCLSFWHKAGTYNLVGLQLQGQDSLGAIFDLNAGTITKTSAGYTSVMTSYGNGWYRCSVSAAMSAGAGFPEFWISGSSSNIAVGRNWAPAGTENLYVWGAQLEINSLATQHEWRTS